MTTFWARVQESPASLAGFRHKAPSQPLQPAWYLRSLLRTVATGQTRTLPCPIPSPGDQPRAGPRAFRAWVSTVWAQNDPYHCGLCPSHPWVHLHSSCHQSPYRYSSHSEALFHSPDLPNWALTGAPVQSCDLGPQSPGTSESM